MNIFKRILRKLRGRKEVQSPPQIDTNNVVVVTTSTPNPVIVNTVPNPIVVSVTESPVTTFVGVETTAVPIESNPWFRTASKEFEEQYKARQPVNSTPDGYTVVTPIIPEILVPALPGFFQSFRFPGFTMDEVSFNVLITSSVSQAYDYLVKHWGSLGTAFREQCIAAGYQQDCSRVVNHFSPGGGIYFNTTSYN
jgi:hypothetical protein